MRFPSTIFILVLFISGCSSSTPAQDATTTTTQAITTTTTQAPELQLVIDVTCSGKDVCVKKFPGDLYCFFGEVDITIGNESGTVLEMLSEDSAMGLILHPPQQYRCQGEWIFEVSAHAEFYIIEVWLGYEKRRYETFRIDGAQWREAPNQIFTKSYKVS